MKFIILIFALIYLSSTDAQSCSGLELGSPLTKYRSVSHLAVVRIETAGPPGCTGTGTGFFINGAGDIGTAGHVFPAACESRSRILIRWNNPDNPLELTSGVEASVLDRSKTLDFAILRPSKISSSKLRYLPLDLDFDRRVDTYKNECGLLTSHYFDQKDILTSFAEISSVALDAGGGKRFEWAVAGDGFNSSRSGSPLIQPSGNAVAVFLARPRNADDRAAVIQNRAYILPFRNIPESEINLKKWIAIPGPLEKLSDILSVAALPANTSTRAWIAYGVSITKEGFRTSLDLPSFVLRNDSLTRLSSLPEAAISAAIGGGSVVREVVEERTYHSAPGFRFTEDGFEFVVESQNPRIAGLPTSRCTAGRVSNCFLLDEAGRKVTFKFVFYPGFDGRRSWLDAEIRSYQVKI